MCPSESRESGHQEGPGGGRQNHDLARRDTVSDRAADEHQRGSRYGFHHHDSAEDRAGTGELQDQPPHPETVLPIHRYRNSRLNRGCRTSELFIEKVQCHICDQLRLSVPGLWLGVPGSFQSHAGPWHPHLMFFLPRMDVAEWGANVPGSPVLGAGGAIEPWTVFFVPVSNWSDGTPDAHPPKMQKM
jgi:hypothetical protein